MSELNTGASGPATPPPRFLTRLLELRARRPSARVQNVLLVLTSAVFIAGAALAYRNLPEVRGETRWMYLLAVGLLGLPATVVLNGLRYQLSARILGHRVGLRSSLRISVLGSAANLLPVPGAVLVRVQALRQLGSNYLQAFGSTGIVAAAWLGVTGVLAGGLQMVVGRLGVGAVLTTGGIAALAAAWSLLRSKVTGAGGRGILLRILVVEVAVALVSMVRLYWVLRGLSLDVSVPQAFALLVAGALASAAGFFPGGLGLREVLAAGLAPFIGLSPAAGFLSVAVDTLISLAGLAFLSLLLLGGGGGTGAPAADGRKTEGAKELVDANLPSTKSA